MSQRMRFTAAKQIFDEFPALGESVKARPVLEAPAAFARALLATEGPFAAIAFIAFLLPRREAVWWGVQSVRMLAPGTAATPAFAAADAWVRASDEGHRQAALRLGTDGDKRLSESWLAMAASHAGGNIAPRGVDPIPAPPQITPVAVKAAIILALAEKPALEQAGLGEVVVEAGLRFAEGGELTFGAPAARKPPPPRAAMPTSPALGSRR